MPNERARALRWAGEFIKELGNTNELSESRRQEARKILRHYPSATEIETKFDGTQQQGWPSTPSSIGDLSEIPMGREGS
ncbi:BPSL0761 family protein [Polaromonas sp.]|uniref:BPSL0761 family protein n=1 Tax=Polaromonas sp. TaxID=1869339 RepID=UPI00326485C5